MCIDKNGILFEPKIGEPGEETENLGPTAPRLHLAICGNMRGAGFAGYKSGLFKAPRGIHIRISTKQVCFTACYPFEEHETGAFVLKAVS